MELNLHHGIIKYHPLRVILHWISAIVIVWSLISGFYSSLVAESAEIKSLIGYINVSLTTLFIPIFCMRIIAAILFRYPSQSDDLSLKAKMVHFIHLMIYVLTAIVLISGVLMMDHHIVVFNLFVLPQPLHDPELITAFHYAHILSCMLLAGIVSLHILAAVTHQLRGKKLLQRMFL